MIYRRMQQFILTLVCALLFTEGQAAQLSHQQLNAFAKSACAEFSTSPATELFNAISSIVNAQLGDSSTLTREEINFRGKSLGMRIMVHAAQHQALNIQLITPPMQPPRTVLTSYRASAMNKPELQLMLDAGCVTLSAQQLFYDNHNNATHLQPLSTESLMPNGAVNWLNPELPPLAGLQPPRLRVGMIDSGVNYLLPKIAQALARNERGQLIGFDFWEMDNKPFDAHPVQSPFTIQRHGTRTASIVIDEAPGIAIVPYRYPRPDMTRMHDLIEHAAQNKVRIIGMPLGGNKFKEWAAFQQAAEMHPEILFIASAGNNGRDIDQRGIYPAALEIDNMLVVTSADDFAKPAERTNYGRIAVDYLLPAEHINALDYNGTRLQVSGSSYAVSRLVALAARILNRHPAMTTPELMLSIKDYSVRANTSRHVAIGYIGDPLVSPRPLKTTALPVPDLPVSNTGHTLALSILVLSHKWDARNIIKALQQTIQIFGQCDISVTVSQWLEIDAPDYLQDLSTGNAMTLRRKLPMPGTSVVFAADTKMATKFDAEAFGEGNTRNRPWLRHSLWITSVTEDTGIALAHELFHIITNDGSHIETTNNLMQESTNPSNSLLSSEQCRKARTYGTQAQLLTAD